MAKQGKISLGNETIAKLAIATAFAVDLRNNDGEVIGPLTIKIVELLDQIESLEHFKNCRN